MRADLGRLGLRAVEVAAQQLLERLEAALAQLGRRHVDLDVELAELGLEGGVGDRRQRLGVLQRRVAVLVDEVELDLEPGHRVVGVEPRLAQHPGEHVEAAPDLLAVARPVGPGELLCLHLFAHVRTLGPQDARGEAHASAVRATTSSTTPSIEPVRRTPRGALVVGVLPEHLGARDVTDRVVGSTTSSSSSTPTVRVSM